MGRHRPDRPLWPVALVVPLLSITSCSGQGGGSRGSEAIPRPATTRATVDEIVTDGACAVVASTIRRQLAAWTGTTTIVNAALAPSRLGPQPAGGLPGTLNAGCVWEARGADGGHVAVAVEVFSATDASRLEAMAEGRNAEAAGTVIVASVKGGTRYDIVGRGETPSGAVLVVTGSEMAVVRVESHSDDVDHGFLAGVKPRERAFFVVVGDALVAERAS